MRVVGTLTTIPSRLLHIEKTLEHIKNQSRILDDIYLTIPKISLKGKEYPNVPEHYNNYCRVVRIEKDYGPVTKILGALYQEKDPETIIISFDDDQLYPSNLVELYLNKIQLYPDAALGQIGFCVGQFPFYFNGHLNTKKHHWFILPEGSEVDILCGYSSVLYYRKFFPKLENLEKEFLWYPMKYKSLRMQDDIFISSYLSSLNHKRVSIDGIIPTSVYLENGLSHETIAFSLNFCQALFVSWYIGLLHSISVKPMNTISGPFVLAFIIILLVVIILIGCWFLFPELLD